MDDFVTFIDRSDQHGNDAVVCDWMHRSRRSLEQDVVSWLQSYEGEEKACIDNTTPESKRQFSKVYAVHEHSRVFVDKPLHQGSPSAPFVQNPSILRVATESSFRLQIKYADGSFTYGSGFFIAPTLALTAGHLFRQRPKKGEIVEVKLYKGILALPAALASSPCHGEVLYHDNSFRQASNGLYEVGADIGLISTSEHSESYLLPCSSSYQVRGQRDVAAISFPAVTEYLQLAEYELMGGGGTSFEIWDAYKPAMKAELTRIANEKGCKEDDPKVIQEAKEILLEMLHDTFDCFATGQMLCAVGLFVDDNGVSSSNSCSTLHGSSGGPICSLDFLEYFMAVHSGGFPGGSTNIATSCDNPQFVAWYCAKVLPHLPSLDDLHNRGIDVRPFVHWLSKHSLWLQQVRDFEQGQKRGRKRAREGDIDKA